MFRVVFMREWKWAAALVAAAVLGASALRAEESSHNVVVDLGGTTINGYVNTTGNSPVPEPSSFGLLAAAFVAAGFFIHRRRS